MVEDLWSERVRNRDRRWQAWLQVQQIELVDTGAGSAKHIISVRVAGDGSVGDGHKLLLGAVLDVEGLGASGVERLCRYEGGDVNCSCGPVEDLIELSEVLRAEV